MRRIISALLAVLMLAALLTVGASAEEDLLQTIQSRGTIIVGLEGDWAPLSLIHI